MNRTLADKLAEIGRRSPQDLHALDVLADLVLKRLGPEQADTAPYHWKCDDPSVTEPGKGGAR